VTTPMAPPTTEDHGFAKPASRIIGVTCAHRHQDRAHAIFGRLRRKALPQGTSDNRDASPSKALYASRVPACAMLIRTGHLRSISGSKSRSGSFMIKLLDRPQGASLVKSSAPRCCNQVHNHWMHFTIFFVLGRSSNFSLVLKLYHLDIVMCSDIILPSVIFLSSIMCILPPLIIIIMAPVMGLPSFIIVSIVALSGDDMVDIFPSGITTIADPSFIIISSAASADVDRAQVAANASANFFAFII